MKQVDDRAKTPEPEYRGEGHAIRPVEWAEPQRSHTGPGEYDWVGTVPRIERQAPDARALFIHGGFFLLSVGTTWLAGGPWYALALMSILLAHEMGHYLTCRRYGVPASLPFFIPMEPHLSLFGTLGAVIRMRGRIPSRRVLFDIAVAGPLAGLVLAIPAVIIGLHLSHIVPVPREGSGLFYLGDSPLFTFLSHMILGTPPEGTDIVLHPVAFAGWAGLFVTALNLLPVGQLDGGHVVYALFGQRARWVSVGVLAAFIGVFFFKFRGWWLLIALLLLFGFRHPAPEDDATPLDAGRRVLGVIILIFFVLTFTPVPMHF
jgi:membrane-associated protease RseP (regulator of RpoE activity)